jgi:D-alanyl-lipoteichoic acid acyltransferase DltB (MBOAT superfamily)
MLLLSFFILGLSKKVLLADPLAEVGKLGFAHPGDYKVFTSWLYALAYSFQLYFDFSGYSDLGIGLAAMFGIRFPERCRRVWAVMGRPGQFV